jgi:phosphoserine phosphatase RsbX
VKAVAERIDGAGVTWGSAMRGLSGETVHGDRAVVAPHPGGVLVAVIDGLGHGQEAARAADRAVEVVSAFPGEDLEELVERCHRELRSSRGVVMTALSLSFAAGTVSSLGVGNVQGMIVRAAALDGRPSRDFILLRGGVVGHTLPPLRRTIVPLLAGDTLVLATDGVGIEFTTEQHLDGEPQALAERILERYALQTDDALVLVARYPGGAR